jgi:hypothetical protein
MKIEITRGGGVAGFATRTELDTDALAPELAQTLAEHVRDAELLAAATAAPEGHAKRHPDELLYAITAHHEGRARTARYSEAQLPDKVRQLIAWVDDRPERTEAIEP